MADVDERIEITRELLAAPLDEFTATRTARVRELKASGAGALAAEVQRLRRPALPPWAPNQLASRPDALAPIREPPPSAADAQSRAASVDLRAPLALPQRSPADTTAARHRGRTARGAPGR